MAENKAIKRKFRVLFIYYNPRRMSLVPPSIAIFSRLLKSAGVEVALFDTTLYRGDEESDSDSVEEKNLTVKPFSDNLNEYTDKIKYKTTDIYADLEKTVSDFRPDLLAVTAVESTFLGTISLLKSIRRHGIPTILGGVFATFASEIAISYPEIDMICIGEGEGAICELALKMKSGEEYSNVPNLWVKSPGGRIVKNKIRPLLSLDDIPLPDMSIFEPGRFYRAMGGRIYKMFAVETHRGCVFSCGFCNSPLQNKLYKEGTKQSYFRYRSIPRVKEEIDYYIGLGAEYMFFWADNFFAYPQKQIDEFCEMYSGVRLPFYCQSHPENLTVERVKSLKNVGMQRIGIGIEHGNEEFRRKVVNRNYSNKTLIGRLKMLTDLGVEYSVNNIIGFPDETPELAMDTVDLNRQHAAFDISCSIFTPFHGTPLRKLAVEKGYLKDTDLIAPSNSDSSVLVMPQFTPSQILGKRRTFNLYIKFPKERWGEIAQAERLTPEGDKIWERLRDECVASYIPKI
ncbi:MAG: radical SAM protein [Candidatus Omnitrophota bacterium]|nr:radical SAM protein [Candidatus Omnitrophota bacterium]